MMQDTEVLRLRLERLIRTTPERAFAAWTQPEQLRRWSAPEGLTIPEGELDLRVGGRWRAVMVEPNGTRHVASGSYREIVPPSRLVYTHSWSHDGGGSTPETVVTVEFIAEGAQTRLVLTQEGFGSVEGRDGHRTGWSSALDGLEALFAKEDA
jgi:uncharacterized protein YndB with AHSA1/START domain